MPVIKGWIETEMTVGLVTSGMILGGRADERKGRFGNCAAEDVVSQVWRYSAGERTYHDVQID